MTRQLAKWSLLAVPVVAVGVSYVLGTLTPAVHVSSGTAYSNGGDLIVGGAVISAEASVKADGWWYGMEGAVMAWEDAFGWHDGGWPSCLSTQGNHEISFGWVSVSTPDGASGRREVVWVECP